jgi:LAO/AO transport system kinase
VRTVASRGAGVDEVVAAIEEHRDWMAARGELDLRRRRRAEAEIEAIALELLRERLGGLRGGGNWPGEVSGGLPGLAKQVVAGELDAYRAADELITELGL